MRTAASTRGPPARCTPLPPQSLGSTTRPPGRGCRDQGAYHPRAADGRRETTAFDLCPPKIEGRASKNEGRGANHLSDTLHDPPQRPFWLRPQMPAGCLLSRPPLQRPHQRHHPACPAAPVTRCADTPPPPTSLPDFIQPRFCPHFVSSLGGSSGRASGGFQNCAAPPLLPVGRWPADRRRAAPRKAVPVSDATARAFRCSSRSGPLAPSPRRTRAITRRATRWALQLSRHFPAPQRGRRLRPRAAGRPSCAWEARRPPPG